MKKIINSGVYIMPAIVLCMTTLMSLGQDSSSSAANTARTTTTTQTTTTVQPWVWVVGAIVLLLIIIALVRGSSKSDGSHTDKVTYTKTTSSQDNP